MLVFKVSAARQEYEVAQSEAASAPDGAVMVLTYRLKWVSPSVSIYPERDVLIVTPKYGEPEYEYCRAATVKSVVIDGEKVVVAVSLGGLLKEDPLLGADFIDENSQYFVVTNTEENVLI